MEGGHQLGSRGKGRGGGGACLTEDAKADRNDLGLFSDALQTKERRKEGPPPPQREQRWRGRRGDGGSAVQG